MLVLWAFVFYGSSLFCRLSVLRLVGLIVSKKSACKKLLEACLQRCFLAPRRNRHDVKAKLGYSIPAKSKLALYRESVTGELGTMPTGQREFPPGIVRSCFPPH